MEYRSAGEKVMLAEELPMSYNADRHVKHCQGR